MGSAASVTAPTVDSVNFAERRETLDGWDTVRLRGIFSLVPKKQREVKVRNDAMYRLLTVRLYAKGVTLRSEQTGGAIKSGVLYRTGEGDFTFSKIDARNGAWGFVHRDLAGGLVSGDFPILRPDHSKADQTFVELALSRPSVWERLRDFAVGTTGRRRLQVSQLLDVQIPLPPLPEQRAIAHVLRTVQRAKEATERVIAATRELKKSLMRYLFTYGPVPISEAEQVPLKETEIGPTPEGWRLTTLGAATASCGGSIQTGPFGSLLHASDYAATGTPFVMPKDLGPRAQVMTSSIARISAGDAARLSRYKVQPGDLLVARRGELGRRALVGADQAEWLCGTGCLRIRPGNLLMPRYLSQVFGTSWARNWLQLNAVGTTMANLSAEILSRLPVPVPPLCEQQEIADALDAVDNKIAAGVDRVAAIDATFDTLLHDLVTGRRRVADLPELQSAGVA